MSDPNKELTVSKWGEAVGVPESIIQEVKTFASSGWALNSYGQSRELNLSEIKMCALACQRTGLSLIGKQVIFLGNGLYVTKGGKIAVARNDKVNPLSRVDVRPATDDERESYGLRFSNPEDALKYEHLWYAEIYVRNKEGQPEKVSNSFGHACIGNIKLKGREQDPTRLCADMASTRAVSRALSQFYDFFGMESVEEILQAPLDTRCDVLPTSEPENGRTNALAGKIGVEESQEHGMDAAHLIAEIETRELPDEIKAQYGFERLETFNQEALNNVWKEIQGMPKVSTPEAEQQKGSGEEDQRPDSEQENLSV